jgi:hypothetical protein
MYRRQVDIERLEGGFRPAPMPPGFVPPVQGLPTLEVLEARRGPWSVGGEYGRLINVAFPDSLAAAPIPIFSLDEQRGPPRPRTLNLFRSDAQLVPGIYNADFYASITYGIGGVLNNFLCDWSRGGQISIVCETLRVDAVAYQPVSDLDYTPPSGTQILGAMLSHEGSAPPRPPTFTTQRAFLPSGFTTDFVVPDFARWVYPSLGPSPPEPAAPTGSILSCRNFSAFVLKEVELTEATLLQGVQLPGGTTEIRIANTTGNIRQYLLSFQLGL